VEGGVDLDHFRPFSPEDRAAARADFGLPSDDLVCGVVGSLQWTPRQQYCYGLELVEMMKYLERPDVSVLIVGDGTGRAHLEARVPPQLRDRVVFAGRVPEDDVVRALNAMDVGFITQTLDGLGSYRLTTKLPEYLATGLPVAMSPIPGLYDYAADCSWPLPALHPATDAFHRGCAALIDRLTPDAISQTATAARSVAEAHFDYNILKPRFQAFVGDLLPQRPSPAQTSPRGAVVSH
jgi:glycosyltransferase involved in cell wall biosynthesis